MQAPPLPQNEEQRLSALYALKILDTPPDERFDRITRLAKHLLGVPIVLVSLVDRDRQWFKSAIGVTAKEMPREISFCGHAILQDDIFLVSDAKKDVRFSDNPLVSDDPNIRFYAGKTLCTAAGENIGSFCVIDQQPRTLTEEQADLLRDLAKIVEDELMLLETTELQQQLAKTNEALALEIQAKKHAESELQTIQENLKQQVDERTAELKKSEAQFRSVFQRNALGIDIIDAEGHIVDCNPAFERMFGYSLQELQNIHFNELTHPEDRDKGGNLYKEMMAGKRDFFQIEKRYYRKDGTLMWGRVTVSRPVTDEGKIAFGFGMVEDITEQKQAQTELKESQERYRRLSESAFEGIFIHDGGRIVDANDVLARMLGVDETENLIGKNGWRFIAPESRREVAKHIRSGDDKVFEGKLQRHDGSTYPVEVIGKRAPFGEKTVGVVAIRDITERKQAEEALRRAEEKYRSIFENAPYGIFQVSIGGSFISANPTLANILKYASPQELMTDLVNGWRTRFVTPKVFDRLMDRLETRGTIQNFEAQVYRQDGEVIWISTSAQTVLDEQGQVLCYEGMVEDITEEKKAQEISRQLELQVVQSERLASVGMVAAGIVHNLRNPLMGVLGFSELLQRKHPDLKELEYVVESANQISEMVENILAKSRHKKDIEPVNLNDLLQRELDFMQADLSFKRDVIPEVNLADNLPTVNCVYTDFSQAFGNLLRNAVEAMHKEKDKKLRVTTTFVGDDGLCVEIGDTGCGIPDENLDNLFEPFFTTKTDAESSGTQGTGIGLYMVKQILEKYDALIEVESKIGEGTTFCVKIPIS